MLWQELGGGGRAFSLRDLAMAVDNRETDPPLVQVGKYFHFNVIGTWDLEAQYFTATTVTCSGSAINISSSTQSVTQYCVYVWDRVIMYHVDSVEVSSTGYHGALCRYQSCYPRGPPLSCRFPLIYAGSGIQPDQFRLVQLVQFSSLVRYLSSSVSVLPSWRNSQFATFSFLPRTHSTGPQLSLQSCSALCLFSHSFQLSSKDLLLNLFFAAPSRLKKALATLSIPAVFLLGL